ncbi:hypothetical protein CRENPOLYSF2_1600002 [Crenothrix polyspora]|uniref:Uncharacterized protein n=1 Tax=Crenothrix polyspora TaxID=360316 RepID=A0A1R4H2F8_9GAMM|nr:hypothetical protein CRENPOLYSF2_1600002 [Crenothrix polyspora]
MKALGVVPGGFCFSVPERIQLLATYSFDAGCKREVQEEG